MRLAAWAISTCTEQNGNHAHLLFGGLERSMLLDVEAVRDVAAARAPDLGTLPPAQPVNIIHMRPPHPGEGMARLDGACSAAGAGGSCTNRALAAAVALTAVSAVERGNARTCMPGGQRVAVQGVAARGRACRQLAPVAHGDAMYHSHHLPSARWTVNCELCCGAIPAPAPHRPISA